jgi:hypothetical protein
MKYFNVQSKLPNISQSVIILGHSNTVYFNPKKAEVMAFEKNIEERHNVSKELRTNMDATLIELGKYSCPENNCNGDSGAPVFDTYNGDLYGVYTITYTTNGVKKRYAISSQDTYNFINSDNKFSKIVLSKEQIYLKKAEPAQEEKAQKGNEFANELKNGKLD